MWDETSREFEGQLMPGERMLWAGRPKPGLALRAGDIIMIPFSLLWGGFAVFWEAGVLRGGAPFIFTLWGVPFVLVGLYMIAGRFFVDAWQRAKTYYALTDERVIIVSGLLSRNVKSLTLKTLQDISFSQKRDGSGTITFGPTHPMGWMYAGSSWPSSRRYAPPCFEMIGNAKEVYDQILAAQKNARSG